MSVELSLLVWSVALAIAYLTVQSSFYRLQHGIRFAGTARDNEAAPDKFNARADKALRNFLETYGVFIALVVATELGDKSSWLSQWGAHLYFWSRWLYLPLYVAGVAYVRSAVWFISAIGLFMMFVGVLG